MKPHQQSAQQQSSPYPHSPSFGSNVRRVREAKLICAIGSGRQEHVGEPGASASALLDRGRTLTQEAGRASPSRLAANLDPQNSSLSAQFAPHGKPTHAILEPYWQITRTELGRPRKVLQLLIKVPPAPSRAKVCSIPRCFPRHSQ